MENKFKLGDVIEHKASGERALVTGFGELAAVKLESNVTGKIYTIPSVPNRYFLSFKALESKESMDKEEVELLFKLVKSQI